MSVPPRWIRRPILIPAVITAAVLCVTTLPMWVLVSAALSPMVPGRLRPLRVLWLATAYLILESLALIILGGLWIASGFGWKIRAPWCQTAHYRLVRWYLWILFGEVRRVLRLRIEVAGPEPDAYPGHPLIVCCRHAGPGDSLILIHALINWYRREPRIVLKDSLQWDPGIDVVLNRLPNRFLSPNWGRTTTPRRAHSRDPEQEIAALASQLDDNDALVIFPEGGNFTLRRRWYAITRLRSLGLTHMAQRAERMRHVLAPRPGGLAAALTAAPEADVMVVAHTGLDHLTTVADIWRELPMDKTITMRWWRIPAADIPRDPEAQISWLYDWWEHIDTWIDEHRHR